MVGAEVSDLSPVAVEVVREAAVAERRGVVRQARALRHHPRGGRGGARAAVRRVPAPHRTAAYRAARPAPHAHLRQRHQVLAVALMDVHLQM